MLCILTTVSLVACGGNSANTATNGGNTEGTSDTKKIISIGIMNAPSGFNPLESTDISQNEASGILYLPLVELDTDLVYKPMLADSIETEDNQTFTVNINEDANWTDGTPVTADDVIFTIGLITNPEVPATIASKFSILEGLNENGKNESGEDTFAGAVKVDDKTVELITKAPVDIVSVQENIGRYLKTMPKHIFESVALESLYQDTNMINPVVTNGAFKLVTYAKDQYVQFAANEEFFKGTPKIDELYLKIMQGSNITVQLESGEIDMNHPGLGLIPFEDYEKVKSMENINATSEGIATTVQTLMINNETITDVRVREALSYAINRDMIINDFLKGDGEFTELPYCGSSAYIDSDIEIKSYDPEKAKALLEEAGWDFDREINFDVPTGNAVREKVADILTANFTEIGLKINVQKYDFVTSLSTARSGDFDIYIVGIPNYPTNADLSGTLATSGNLNISKYSSEEMDELLTAGLNETDIEKKKEIYSDVQELFMEDLPCPSVYIQNQLKAVNKRVLVGEPKDFGTYIDLHLWDVE